MMRAAVLVVLMLSVVACVSASAMNREMDSWIGADSNTVQQSWGPPTASATLPDGSLSLAYTAGGCDVVFGLDVNGIVKTATWRGSKYKCNKQVRGAPAK